MKLFITLFFIGCLSVCAQVSRLPFTLEYNHFYGSIIEHNDEISHLLTGHPTGYMLSFNQKTYGFESWEARYNYPDYGFSYIKQNLKNPYLGKNFGLYTHFNFYFFKRNLMLRMAQGIAYAGNPYDKKENYRNNAYGSRLLSSTYMMLQFRKENIFKGLGVNAGVSVIHYSNANFKAPNASTNTFALNLGVNYLFRYKHNPTYRTLISDKFYKERIKYNIVARGGINESDVVGTGQFPFFVFSAYADKKISHYSGLSAGFDVFLSGFLKEHVKYLSIAHPDKGVKADTDYKRLGIFVGHELYINKVSFVTQLGFYAYYPFEFEGRFYNRLGMKYYFSERVFGALTLKAHAAKAEAVEFGIGIKI